MRTGNVEESTSALEIRGVGKPVRSLAPTVSSRTLSRLATSMVRVSLALHFPSSALLRSPCCPPGDEGGESELLGEDLPLEPSVTKAERSHLIVWQVMCGSE